MIKHPRLNELIFSADKPKSRNRLDIQKVSVDGGMDREEYLSSFKVFLDGFYSNLFFQCVLISWFRRKFMYFGYKSRIPMYSSTRFVVSMFLKTLRRSIGHDLQIITKGPFFNKLETYYFDSFFPDFERENPLTNPDYYKFPYKNISLEYLLLVYQLDDRFDLLDLADDEKMTYAVFADYVMNHIIEENKRLGRERYLFSQGVYDRARPEFFRDTDKHFRPNKGEKRI